MSDDDSTIPRSITNFGADILPPSGTSVSLADAAARYKPRIEGYEIEDKLGEGGMATVWRGTQLSTKRKVALKLMNAVGSDSRRLRFDREVRLTAGLEHSNICRIYDSGVHHGVYFYAMELIHGEPLDEYVAMRSLGQHDILVLMRDVALAVAYAHQHGVIHRDLKFTNVLVSPDGQPHLLDFGLARAMAVQPEDTPDAPTRSAVITLDGEVAGTPAFMSPEQAAGNIKDLDTRSDVYSLGVMLYRLLLGAWPHDMTGAHHVVLARIREEEAIRPRLVKAATDMELEALLLKALHRDPEQRYATGAELAADIDRYLRGEPLTARKYTTLVLLQKRLKKHLVPLLISSVAIAALLVAAIVTFPTVITTTIGCLVLAGIVLALWEIRRQRDHAIVQRNRIEALLRISEAMNRQKDLASLWNLILTEARKLSHADAGSLFIREGDNLHFVIAQNDTLSKTLGTTGVRNLFAKVTLPIRDDSIVGYVAMTGKPVNLPDVRHLSPRLPFRHNPDSDLKNQYDTRAVLAVPLTDPDGQVLGVLQLLNCQSPSGQPIPFPREQDALIQSMAAQAAIALRYFQLKDAPRSL